MAESQSGDKGPISRSIKIFSVLLLILYLGKVYLRAPEYRHIEVCYLPHKIMHFVWVDVWGAFAPSDSTSYLSHARDTRRFFFTCTTHTAGWNWLRSFGSPK